MTLRDEKMFADETTSLEKLNYLRAATQKGFS